MTVTEEPAMASAGGMAALNAAMAAGRRVTQRLGRLARFSSEPGKLPLLFLTPARKAAWRPGRARAAMLLAAA